MTQSFEINIGDRIVYHDEKPYDSTYEYSSSDTGTVIEKHENITGAWWVLWDNGHRLYVTEEYKNLYTVVKNKENTKNMKIEIIDKREVTSPKFEPGQTFEWNEWIFVVCNHSNIFAWSLCGQCFLTHDDVISPGIKNAKPVKVTCTIK